MTVKLNNNHPVIVPDWISIFFPLDYAPSQRAQSLESTWFCKVRDSVLKMARTVNLQSRSLRRQNRLQDTLALLPQACYNLHLIPFQLCKKEHL